MKRAIIIIIDSLGVGAMEDAPDYNDGLECNTLSNLATANGGVKLPHLGKLGLGNITNVKGVEPIHSPQASFGKMKELSKGKDSTTGHWEVAGIVSEKGFSTYPNGFPKEFMDRFVERTGCGGYFGNKPASGTAIIDEFHAEHRKTAYPIIYTSADSVFQIACDVDIIGLETLYKWCEIAREMLDEGYNCSRVIARPYRETDQGLERLGGKRKDYSVPPPKGSLLDKIAENGGRVLAIGKTEDLFVGKGVTHSIHTSSNDEGLRKTVDAIKGIVDYDSVALSNEASSAERELIFTNLVETDMIYGHRRDVSGYASALEQIDEQMPSVIEGLQEDDMLIITADHGCDPTAPGSDHTREMVPVLVYGKNLEARDLGVKDSFTFVASTIADWLEIPSNPNWVN